MSFHLRSLSARRYRIEGDLPPVGDDAFARRLLDRAFHPLTAHEERAFGWVTADNCLDARFESGSIARGPCAVFSMRLDKRRVNGRLLRAMIDLEMRGRRKDSERNAEGVGSERAAQAEEHDDERGAHARAAKAARPPGSRLSRDERQELRRQITEELMRNTTPTMEVHPVVLYPREKLVLFGGLSKPANELFRTLFTDTFEVTLTALTPYHRAVEILSATSSGGGGEPLAGLRRTDFGVSIAAAGRTDSVLVASAGRTDGVPPSIGGRASRSEEVLR